MKVKQVLKQIKENQLHQNYLLLGSETFLQTEFIHGVSSELTTDDRAEVIQMNLNDVSLQAVLDEAESYSFFNEYRLIIVDNVTFLNAQGGQKHSEQELKNLENYLANANPQSIIVWRVGNDSIDKRKKLSKLFAKMAVTVEVGIVDNADVEKVVQSFVNEHQLKMSKSAQQELLLRVQSNLSSAMSELHKLLSYAANGNEITVEVIQNLVPRVLESNIFELTNALLGRKPALATQIYEDLLLMGQGPIAINGLIASQFRLMIQVKLLASTGQLDQNIASQLDVHPYRVKLAREASQKYQLKQMQHYYLKIIDTDYQMKSGIGDKQLYFYLLLTEFMQMK